MQPLKKDLQQSLQNRTVELTQNLLRIPSVTALDAKDRPYSRACLDMLAEVAGKSGASVRYFSFEGGHPKWDYAVDNIYIEWVFGKGSRHLVYLGHIDVVPPGDVNRWSLDPFAGDIRDGYLYGRGATDMKGSVAAFLAAAESLSGIDLRLGMLITADEEWAAVNGTKKVLEALKAEGVSPDAFIVGEPSSQDVLGTHIKIGRRGSLCGTFRVQGVQGHAAYQGSFENPNRALALAMSILTSQRFNDGNDNFPNTNFEPIAIQSGNFSASAVVPGGAEMLWNIRYTPAHTPDSLEAWVAGLLANPPAWAQSHPDAAMLKNVTVVANKDTASLPYCTEPGRLAAAARGAVEAVLGRVPVVDGSGGTTDGRFAAALFPDAEIIELGLPERGGITGTAKPDDYLLRGGMHQVDERASVADLVHLQEIFRETVIRYGA